MGSDTTSADSVRAKLTWRAPSWCGRTAGDVGKLPQHTLKLGAETMPLGQTLKTNIELYCLYVVIPIDNILKMLKNRG